MSKSLKVEFIDNASSQYDDNASIIKYKTNNTYKDKKYGKLYLGDQFSASYVQLKSRNCKHVVNCSREMHGFCKENDVKYLKVDPDDDNVDCYDDTYQFIINELSNNHNVVVHCENGVNKSALVVLYFLMKQNCISLSECYEYIKKQRNRDLKIVPRLLKELIKKEKQMRGFSTLVLDGKKVINLKDSLNYSNNTKKSKQSNISSYWIIGGVCIFFISIYIVLVIVTGKT